MYRVLSIYRRAALAFLIYTIFIIVWGGYVRASLSGDGCLDEWPLCRGKLIPIHSSIKTWIEYIHRLTSGIGWLLSLGFYLFSRFYLPPFLQKVRKNAFYSFVCMSMEGLIGAALVLLKLVSDNPSSARMFWVSAHLVNTFFLLGFLTLHVYWCSAQRYTRGNYPIKKIIALMVGWLIVGVSGALNALVDTLFAVDSMHTSQTLSSLSLERLRSMHPIFALGLSFITFFYLFSQRFTKTKKKVMMIITALLALQISVGLANIYFTTPIILQMVHLLLADLLWVHLVWMAALMIVPKVTSTSTR